MAKSCKLASNQDLMSESLPKWRQLSENKQKAVKLRAEGVTMEAIAAELVTPGPTVRDWFCGPSLLEEELYEYKMFLADKQIESTEEFQKRIAKDADALWDRLKALALSDESSIPKHVILGALDSALDRIGIARVSKTEGKLGLTVTDEDRAKRFKEIAELQADIQPIQLKRLAGGK